jgi:hypothetical protein
VSHYTFAFKPITGSKLSSEIVASGLPSPFISVSEDSVRVSMPRDLTEPEFLTLSTVIEAHTINAPRKAKLRSAIRSAVATWLGTDASRARQILIELAVDFLERHPSFLRDRGIPIDGDELDV